MRRTETFSRAPDRPHRAAAAEASGRGTASGPAAQRRLAEAVQQAPAMVVQRERLAVLQAYKWHKVKRMDGKFVGDETAFHIHAAGGDEHFKYGKQDSTRVDYMSNGAVNQSNLRNAIETCEGLVSRKGYKIDLSGKAECLERMRELLETDTTAPKAETKVEEKPVETTTPAFTGASPYGPVDKTKPYAPPSEDDFL